MLNNNKYYTPKIEEFHIGFECEFKNRMIVPVEWRKEVCETETLSIAFDTWEHEQEEFKDEFRVKHLDQEDIVELGYKFNGNFYEKPYNDPRQIYSQSHLIFIPKTNHVVVQIGSQESPFTDFNTLFVGTIKNKSELKKILNQLNITTSESY